MPAWLGLWLRVPVCAELPCSLQVVAVLCAVAYRLRAAQLARLGIGERRAAPQLAGVAAEVCAASKHVQLARLGTGVCGAAIRRLHHHRSGCRGFAARPASGRRVRPPGWVPTCTGAVPRLAGVAALVRGVACSSQTLRRAGCAPPLHGSCPAARRCSCLGSRRGLQLANVAARRLRTAVHDTALRFQMPAWSWLLPCSPSAGVRGRGHALPLQVAPMWRVPSSRTLIRGIGTAAGSRVLPTSRVAVDGGLWVLQVHLCLGPQVLCDEMAQASS
jgi:hypothetical protein